MRRWAWVIGLFVIAACAVAAFGRVHGLGPLPVAAAGPPNPLPRATPGRVCLGGPDHWDQGGLPAMFWVGVDANPRSVTAVWWPTMNDSDCRVVSSQGDAAVAGVLARDIRHAPAFGSGVHNCATDVGGAVDLYFAYPRGRWERVRVYPTGCAHLTAHSRKPRRAQFTADLAPIAPPGVWRQILG